MIAIKDIKEMNKLIPILLAALALMAFREPVKPDLQMIRSEVTNPDSRYYYPKLMAEYERNETIQTWEDYRHLYLGALFQEDFNPYRRSAYAGLIEELYYKSRHSRSECDSIIKYAELSLQDNPFDLRQINFMIYALREKQKNNVANIWQFRLNHLLEAIVTTGTGTSAESAWYVINPQHEYYVLNMMGRVAKNHEFLSPGLDHISVVPKDDKDTVSYYFDVRHILDEYYRKFPEEE